MMEFYQRPRSVARFQSYLQKLQGGSKGDLKLPIGSFNPMAKDHVLEKLSELKELKAEEVMREALDALDSSASAGRLIEVVLNLADDFRGGWTNRYTTDFDSKFKLNALVTRNFCTPHFWTSESYDRQLIYDRTQHYALRTLYWIQHGRLSTLEQHLKQEIFVARHAPRPTIKDQNLASLETLYKEFKLEDDYSLLFNFFYGDAASMSLNYATYGVTGINGFEYANLLARQDHID